ncbi:MAG: glycoside hydrolase family 2 TIM barrel-domain containing protein [Lachnospiraceae bacterium]|nr:glycoside hydrolase family 2 TIM barrel-domain containing protein [Lachnospiraceae bacterium]
MKKINFKEAWICYRADRKEHSFAVTLPHDAMLLDERKENSPGGVNNGWIDAHDYTYEKTFSVPEEEKGQKIILEFEGVYHRASIYLNDEKICYHDYGYTGFYVDITNKLLYGKENLLRVEAKNSDQPNSRWYSGTGIYRPVWMYLLPKEHILLEGIRVTTLDYKNPEIQVEASLTGSGKVRAEILDGDTVIYTEEMEADQKFSAKISLPGAKLWSPKAPNLYTCRITYGEDVQEETFGIRKVECTPKKGFCINGKRIILRGACIHHDNGILGACAYDFAERRKVRIMLENGYNALRSAHNPCSKAMLKACDEMGMLMMDEYVDVWYIHKTKYDYALEVEKNYEADLEMIVAKDYNHPSVVLYSTGNEVSETAQKKGIALCGKLTERLHELDATRPVTCGINIFFNFLSSMGFGVYSDKKAEQAVEDAVKKKAVGSEFFNSLAGLFGSGFMKFGAALYPCDLKTKDSFANMDVAGYNYGIRRYDHDVKKYPDRIILGSETFCSDAYLFWEKAKNTPAIIGDFVWAGMDYLGEVGIGSWEYEDYAPKFDNSVGWVSAGSGRIDLTGKPLAEMKYTQVAFELEKIGIGVIPVNNAAKRHSPSAWKMTNAVESWSWSGCDGMATKVEVYARAAYVRLYINGELIGTKKPAKDCRVIFDVKYRDGEVRAIAFDENKHKIADKILKTAGKETKLTLLPEQTTVKKDDLCYIRLRYTDKKGIVKPLERGDITVEAEGGTLLGLGSACPYYPQGYLGHTADTYYGEALAVVRPDGAGKVVLKADSKYGSCTAQVKVEE